MLRAAARESARARARFANLKTNRVRKPDTSQRSGVHEIKTTLRARWSEIGAQGISYHDLLAGLTVATVAIPLNVALAISDSTNVSSNGAIGPVSAAAAAGSPPNLELTDVNCVELEGGV